MSAHDLNDLERSVLERLLAGEHPVLVALRTQLDSCCVKNRELTGCGFFTELQVDRTIPPAPTSAEELRIGDVTATIAGLKHGAGFVLFINAGYLDMLEGYSYDEPWPGSIDKFNVSYTGEPRDLRSLHFE